MDKMREEFEAWGENQYEEHWPNLCGRTKENLFDCYKDAWQASRKALVVELPTTWNASFTEKAIVMDADSVVEALDAAGVAYK